MSCGHSQIPPDFVVKAQAIDIMDVIRSRIRRQNVVQTLSSNRLSRYKPLSASEASWFTTKSVGVWDAHEQEAQGLNPHVSQAHAEVLVVKACLLRHERIPWTPPIVPAARRRRGSMPGPAQRTRACGHIPHAPQRTNGPCLLPDHSGGHVASSSSQRNR
jgi:hypothetical protein